MYEYDVSDSHEGIEHDYLATLVWAAMLIWAGVVFLAGFQGWLRNYPLPELQWFLFLRDWLMNSHFDFRVIPLIFSGDALILMIEFLIRLIFPIYHRSLTNILVIIVIFCGLTIGSWGLAKPELIIPYSLIGIGISILLGMLFRKRKPQK